MIPEIDRQPEPPGRPALGHNRAGADDLREQVLDEFSRILLTDRSADTPSFLDAIFQKAQLVRPGAQAANDVLLSELFLFEEGRLPQHNNVFNADMGLLTERFVCALFKITRGSDVDITEKGMASLQAQAEMLQTVHRRKNGKTSLVQWKKGDLLMSGAIIVECKYRFNSYESKTKQIQVAAIYKELGLKPVFLHLSPDFQHRAEFEASGWTVYVGEEALDYIESHTGFNLRDLFRELSARPVVRQRILDEHQSLLERQKAQLWSDYYFAPDDIRDDFHTRVTTSTRSLQELAESIEKTPPAADILAPSVLADRTEEWCDEKIRNQTKERKDALLRCLQTLDQTDRVDVLYQAMKAADPETRMSLMSIFG